MRKKSHLSVVIGRFWPSFVYHCFSRLLAVGKIILIDSSKNAIISLYVIERHSKVKIQNNTASEVKVQFKEILTGSSE